MVKHTLCEICDKLHEDFDESDVILSTDLNHHHEDWSEFLHAQLTLDHVVKILLADGDLMFPVETEFVWPDEE
jgi:hypothetical protein